MRLVHKKAVNAQLLKGDNIILAAVGAQLVQFCFQRFTGALHLLDGKILSGIGFQFVDSQKSFRNLILNNTLLPLKRQRDALELAVTDDTMNTLEQLGVISALNDSYRESHGLASSNALDSAFDELENELDDALADSASSEAEPESETASVRVAESVPYTETADTYDADDVFPAATRFDEHVTSTNGMDTYSKLAGEISANHNGCEELTEEQREYFLSYGSYFQTAWLNAMYTDVDVDTGKYGNAVAWNDLTNYMYFFDEVTDYNDTELTNKIWSVMFGFYDEFGYDIDTLTDDEIAPYIDEVIQIAEANGAEVQFW